jgi:hypothetical protein
VEPVRQTKERMVTMNMIIDLRIKLERRRLHVVGPDRGGAYQASQTAGIASSTHTFHRIAVLVRRAS